MTTKQKSAKSSMFWLWELPSRGKFRSFQNNSQGWQPGGTRQGEGKAWIVSRRRSLPLRSSPSPATDGWDLQGQTRGRPASSGPKSSNATLDHSPPGHLLRHAPAFPALDELPPLLDSHIPPPQSPELPQSQMHHSGLYLPTSSS